MGNLFIPAGSSIRLVDLDEVVAERTKDLRAQRDRLRRYILADRAVGRYRSPEAHLPRDQRIYDPEEHRLLIEWREALRDVTEHGDLGDEA